MDRSEALAIINAVLAKSGRDPVKDSNLTLREAGISSLEFSLVALSVEDRIGGELDFGGATSWCGQTVADAIDLFTSAVGKPLRAARRQLVVHGPRPATA